LPGAFGIMAKAVGVTEKELGNMMKAGELLASDVLPKFAQQLEKTYGIENINRIETMTSAQNRLSNSWTNLVNSFYDGEGIISKAIITNTPKDVIQNVVFGDNEDETIVVKETKNVVTAFDIKT
jgi:hypothetical protein